MRVKNRLNFEAKVTDENQSYNNEKITATKNVSASTVVPISKQTGLD